MNTSRISLVTGGSMIAIAALLDATDLGLAGGLVGFIVGIPASLLFGIWFSHRGVSMLHHTRALKFIGTVALEVSPASAFPMWTYAITSTVLNEWQSAEGV